MSLVTGVALLLGKFGTDSAWHWVEFAISIGFLAASAFWYVQALRERSPGRIAGSALVLGAMAVNTGRVLAAPEAHELDLGLFLISLILLGGGFTILMRRGTRPVGRS